MENRNIVLSVKDLAISFSTDHGRLHAVRGVDFDLYKGEVLAIVGESGSGKSVSAKTIMGILPNNGRVDKGEIYYEGEDLVTVSEEEFHRIRGKKIGMIFQDPLSSLNPIMKIGRQLTEAIIINGNKIKILYEDLIAPANIAYLNEKTKFDRIIKDNAFIVTTTTTEVNLKIDALKENKALTKEEKKAEIAALKAELNEVKQEHRVLVKKVKEEAKPVLKELKLKLNESKKQATIEVNEHKAQLKNAHAERMAALKAELAEASDEATSNAVKTKMAEEKNAYIDSVKITPARAKQMAIEVMGEVGIPQPERRYRQYPFEFSGGMRQRIVIAIALIQNPDVLICDEPTTALDVTIQAQILELILRLKNERQLSVIFITHDLGVVANMADRVAVMYAGRIVEFGNVEEIFYNPQHPYTWALLSSIPDVDSKERLEAIPGTPPNMVYPPKGDAFALRSKYALAVDFKEEPPLFKVSDTHYARTWLLDPRAPKVERPKIVTERIRISLERAGK